MTTPSSSHLPHFSEHLASVRRHHEQLNEHMSQTGETDAGQASRSLMFTNLRSQLQDLDSITSALRTRLHPTARRFEEEARPSWEDFPAAESADVGATQGGVATTEALANPGSTHTEPMTSDASFSRTLLHAQNMLQVADQLIANMNPDVTPRYDSQDGGRHVYPARLAHSPERASGEAGALGFGTWTQESEELPNYSMYPKFPPSNTNTDTPHASSEQAIRTVHAADFDVSAASPPGDVGAYDNGSDDDFARQQAWMQRSGSILEDDDADDEDFDANDVNTVVVAARPLNDVSSANFNNYAHQPASLQAHAPVAVATVEEQDSWFSGHGNPNLSRAELYETITSEGEDAEEAPPAEEEVQLVSHSQPEVVEVNAKDGNSSQFPVDVRSPSPPAHPMFTLPPKLASQPPVSKHNDAPAQRHDAQVRSAFDIAEASNDVTSARSDPPVSSAASVSYDEDFEEAEDDVSSDDDVTTLAKTNPMLMTQKTIRIDWARSTSGRDRAHLQDDVLRELSSPRSSDAMEVDMRDVRGESDVEASLPTSHDATLEAVELASDAAASAADDVENRNEPFQHDVTASREEVTSAPTSARSGSSNRNGNNNGHLPHESLETTAQDTPRSDDVEVVTSDEKETETK